MFHWSLLYDRVIQLTIWAKLSIVEQNEQGLTSQALPIGLITASLYLRLVERCSTGLQYTIELSNSRFGPNLVQSNKMNRASHHRPCRQFLITARLYQRLLERCSTGLQYTIALSDSRFALNLVQSNKSFAEQNVKITKISPYFKSTNLPIRNV